MSTDDDWEGTTRAGWNLWLFLVQEFGVGNTGVPDAIAAIEAEAAAEAVRQERERIWRELLDGGIDWDGVWAIVYDEEDEP